MADTAIFVGFGNPVRGRERKAIQVFDEAMQYYGRLQQEGTVESVEPVFLEPHGGDLNGFILLRGERARLAEVWTSEEFERLNLRAGLVVEGFGVVGGALGDRVATQMAQYSEQLGDLT
jgi:hypothetical protein